MLHQRGTHVDKEITGTGRWGRVQVQRRGTERSALHLHECLEQNHCRARRLKVSSSSPSLHRERAFMVQLLKISVLLYLGRHEVIQLQVTPAAVALLPATAILLKSRNVAFSTTLRHTPSPVPWEIFLQTTNSACWDSLPEAVCLSSSHWQTLMRFSIFYENFRGIYTSQGEKQPNFLLPDTNPAKGLV